jgi:adhesin transport system outer membrane protein
MMAKLQEQILVSNENIIEHQRLLALIEHRAEGQVSPQSEYIMAKARLSTARNERMQYQNALVNAKADLEQLTSQKIVRLVAPKLNIVLSDGLVESLNKALEYSPQLKKMEADIFSADADTESKKSLLYPQLSARHEIYNGSNYPSNMTYLALTYQPGNGLSAFSSIHQAEARKDNLEAQKATFKKDLSDKIRNDFNVAQLSLNQIDVLSELSASSDEVYESFVRQFPTGRKEATQAKLSLSDAKWGGYAASLRIKITTGEIIPSALGALNLSN